MENEIKTSTIFKNGEQAKSQWFWVSMWHGCMWRKEGREIKTKKKYNLEKTWNKTHTR